MTDNTQRKLHPGVVQAQMQLQQGRISRREFLRVATLLGTSIPTASFLAACGGASSPASEAPAEAPEDAVAPDGASESAAEAPATSGSVKRGGTLRVGMKIQAADHPARFSWTESANAFRHVFEYLTETDEENITYPLLLESWEPNDDLTVWTLKLREGIMWVKKDDPQFAEELVAEHIKFNFEEWLNPETGSSILALWEGSLTPDGVEIIDKYTVQLNLDQPKLDVPESLFHYPAQILHPSFNGDATTGTNPSTGPFFVEEYITGERAVLVRRPDDYPPYWQMGEDGNPLPYLDRIEFQGLGDDQTAYVAAIQTGEIDTMYEPTVDTWDTLRNDPNFVVYPVDTSQVRVLRVRVDQPPWDNEQVRLALKLCQDRAKILDLAYRGEGLLGHDFHVSPVHPEFYPMDEPGFDPERASELLAEAGFASGIDADLSIGTGWSDVVIYAETLQQDAAQAGFNLTLQTMPNTAYWDQWTEVTMGITPWTHRPLAVMLLSLGYTADDEGEPVPWNETRWVDAEFSESLREAQGILDPEARSEVMAEIERIQMERGPIGIVYWTRKWEIFTPAFQGIQAHPTLFNIRWREVWYEPDLDPFA